MAIADEKRAFEKTLPALLKKHKGQYVVFYNREQHGIYPDFDAAYVAALDEFGVNAEFLVSKIEQPGPPQPVSLSWDAGVMFG